MYSEIIKKNAERENAINVAQILIDEMNAEIKYAKDYAKVYEKAEKMADEARKKDEENEVRAYKFYSAWDYISWENKQRFFREPKGDAWFKRRAMVIRETMLGLYGR